MPDFDRIDLMNFAIYGNDFDSQWDEIRAYLKSSAHAQRELEEIKKSLPAPSLGKKRRDNYSSQELSAQNETDPSGKNVTMRPPDHQTKSWWSKIIGD